MSHFKLLSSTKASDVIPVNKYVSEKTGLTVIIANVEGPLVNGFFCLATEAHDDDGLPHTLEHLIFLGSERYPYKGILDLLANRCMAHGTNAWTDTDHTCYTIDTAGDAGMLTLLPIYLDHILNPTLTNEGFITEVHHIDGDGEDAGVVYCEMQGRENTADSRCELRLLRAMYPNSGYSAETGGIMKNLRVSTNNTKVRDFHKKFYRAENLTIILTGQIEPDDVFNALTIVENDVITKREKEAQEDWVKPWQTIPPPPHYGELAEQWPADTEDCGQVLFGWRGPVLGERASQKQLTACAVALRYLCDTAAAPLQRCLVERQDALAGDVSYNIRENLATLIKIELDNVPINKLEIARDEARNCIKGILSGEETIDMERMERLLKKQLREITASLESDPHHAIAFRCIGDALYSQNEEDFIFRVNPQQALLELLNENADYWLQLLNKYFTDDVVTVIGSPSIELQTKMAEYERKRLEEQRALLGEKGLAEKAKQLEEAMDFNERAPPPGTLAAVPVPSCDRLRCHAIASWSTGDTCPYFPLDQIPLFTRLHSLKTNLVYMHVVLDTGAAPRRSRRWLPLLLDALGECAVLRDGALVPHDDVIAATERLTVSCCSGVGFDRPGHFSVGHFGNFVYVEMRCEPSEYEKVVNHLYEIIYMPEITKDRLLVFAQRLLNDVAQVRRNGSKMSYDILRDSLYKNNSNMHWCTVLRQQKFLKEIIEQLNAGGEVADAVIKDAKMTLKELTCRPWLHIAADLKRYNLSAEPWKKFAISDDPPIEPQLYWDADLMEECGFSCAEGVEGVGGARGAVVGVGGVESCFLAQYSGGPRGHSLADVAPLNVALNYFTQLEGPMWRLVRGCGLAYSYGVRGVPGEARLQLSLYRATNAVAAYAKVQAIVENFLADGKFDEDLFASAKSTALFEVVENEKCPADVVHQSLLNYLKRAGDNYNRELVCAVAAVTEEGARAAAERWLPPLCAASPPAPTSAPAPAARPVLCVVCHPSKVADMQAAFRRINVELDAYESMEASPFNN